jgi:hypothetical protein
MFAITSACRSAQRKRLRAEALQGEDSEQANTAGPRISGISLALNRYVWSGAQMTRQEICTIVAILR